MNNVINMTMLNAHSAIIMAQPLQAFTQFRSAYGQLY